MQPASEAPDIASLLAETRAALAHLRAEELEALAARAEEMLRACSSLSTKQLGSQAAALRREHRLLGDVLGVTAENLRVLRRAGGDAEGRTRWVR